MSTSVSENPAASKTKKKKDPSAQCGKCDTNLKSKDKAVQCSTCSTQFHTTCQNVSDTLFDLLSSECDGVLWFCNICRKTTRGMIQKMSNMELRLQAIEAGRSKDNEEVKGLHNLVLSLQETCKALEKKVKQLTEDKQLVAENQEKTLQSISIIRRDLYKEHDKNVSLHTKIDDMDQRQRENNVRVVGLPGKDDCDNNINSNLVQLVGATDIQPESIISATRMGRIRGGRPRDLVVKFSTKTARDKFYALRKKTPKDEENNKVFINEDLTEARAKLFYDARRMVKRSKLFGTWSQNGNIMVKVTESDNPAVIHNHQDLASLTRYVSEHETFEDELSIDTDFFESGVSD